jgi:hypothetical protein
LEFVISLGDVRQNVDATRLDDSAELFGAIRWMKDRAEAMKIVARHELSRCRADSIA